MSKLREIVLSTAARNLAVAIIGVPFLLVAYYALKLVLESLSSPLRKLQGPPGGRFLSGHMLKMTGGQSYETLVRWREQYGHVFSMKAVLGQRRLVTTDPVAIAYILANNQKYYKPEAARWHLSYILGHGMVTAEGAEHRQQRKAINPAFSSSSLKSLFPSFMSKSEQLRDKLREQLGGAPSARVDMLQWISRAALDIIALSGFNYDLDTLHQGVHGSQLATALHQLSNPKTFPLLVFFKIFVPPLRLITFDHQSKEARRTKAIIRKIGVDIIEETQRELELEKANGKSELKVQGLGTQKDLLSSIVRLNMASTSTDTKVLTMDQMLLQIPTFLIAGHETTANTLAWGLFSLSQDPSVQTRLREELCTAFPGDSAPAELEDLNALPYLEAFVRETLRFHAGVELVGRVAEEDDVVRLEKGYYANDGSFHDHIRLKKGDHIMIPVLLINRMKDFWGADADTFNPDRWLGDLPSASNSVPGLWANTMTFSGGPRSCIGYRFALYEIKTLLLCLVRSFYFELAVDPNDVMRNEMIVTRPLVRSEKEKGAQLPMILRPVTYV